MRWFLNNRLVYRAQILDVETISQYTRRCCQTLSSFRKFRTLGCTVGKGKFLVEIFDFADRLSFEIRES